MCNAGENPDWLADVLAAAEDKAYQKGYSQGWEEGQKNLWYRLRDKLKMEKPHGA